MNFFVKFFLKCFVVSKIQSMFANVFREISSAGSEHLPYKQGVNGSNPLSPTKKVDSTKKSVLRFKIKQAQGRLAQ